MPYLEMHLYVWEYPALAAWKLIAKFPRNLSFSATQSFSSLEFPQVSTSFLNSHLSCPHSSCSQTSLTTYTWSFDSMLLKQFSLNLSSNTHLDNQESSSKNYEQIALFKITIPFHDIPGRIKMEGKIYLRKKIPVHFNTTVHPDGTVFVKVCTSLTVVLLMLDACCCDILMEL